MKHFLSFLSLNPEDIIDIDIISKTKYDMQTTSIPSMKRITSTVECYDAWSNTYDTDGNVLQLLDDIAFEEIAQPLLDSFPRNETTPICCELGCGTGRNTIKILHSNWSIVSRN